MVYTKVPVFQGFKGWLIIYSLILLGVLRNIQDGGGGDEPF